MDHIFGNKWFGCLKSGLCFFCVVYLEGVCISLNHYVQLILTATPHHTTPHHTTLHHIPPHPPRSHHTTPHHTTPHHTTPHHTTPLGHVPHTDALVFGVAENEFLAGVEKNARHVIVVAPARVHLPGLRLCHNVSLKCHAVVTCHECHHHQLIQLTLTPSTLHSHTPNHNEYTHSP